jgi:hypothetical protein
VGLFFELEAGVAALSFPLEWPAVRSALDAGAGALAFALEVA